MLFGIVLALVMGGFGHALREKAARAEYPTVGQPDMENANILRELSYVVRGLVSLAMVLMLIVSFTSGHADVGVVATVQSVAWLLSFIGIHQVVVNLRRRYLSVNR